MQRLRTFLQNAIKNTGYERRETLSAVACIVLVYGLVVVAILTWGQQP